MDACRTRPCRAGLAYHGPRILLVCVHCLDGVFKLCQMLYCWLPQAEEHLPRRRKPRPQVFFSYLIAQCLGPVQDLQNRNAWPAPPEGCASVCYIFAYAYHYLICPTGVSVFTFVCFLVSVHVSSFFNVPSYASFVECGHVKKPRKCSCISKAPRTGHFKV